jgi:hypothetical protein
VADELAQGLPPDYLTQLKFQSDSARLIRAAVAQPVGPWTYRMPALPFFLLRPVSTAALRGLALVAFAVTGCWALRGESHAAEFYHEVMIGAGLPTAAAKTPAGSALLASAHSAAGDVGYSLDPCPCESDVLCEPACCCQPWYYLWAYGGASYFDTPTNSALGGLYAVDLAVPFQNGFGAIGGGFANHYGGGEQWGGMLGIYKATNYYGVGWDRIGGAAVIDDYTDTGLGSPNWMDARYRLDYRIHPVATIGVQYTDPIQGGLAFPAFPAPGFATSPVETIEAQLRIGSVNDHLYLSAGYITDFDSLTFTADWARIITDRVSARTAVTYDENVGLWTGFVGLQIDLSPYPGPAFIASNSVGGDVVRGGALGAASLAFDDWMADEFGITMSALGIFPNSVRSGSNGQPDDGCDFEEEED